MKKITAIILLIAVMLSAYTYEVTAVEKNVPIRDSINVEKINFQRSDFIRGMDVSSVISLEKSGVVYCDENGAEQDIFKILADNGVNYIRVRVWNQPYDSDGKGYGGGNNDVKTAAEIGKRAAAYGLKLLVDFHYSDFWADPGKQKAPKSWENLSVTEKTEKVMAYTFDALTTISEAGADIGMVQIGNETNNGIAGVYSRDEMAGIFNAGAQAVREFSEDVLVALHFTNPERTENLKWIADDLFKHGVDYDVFAISYYPYWHGSLENLTDVFNYVANSYGKYGLVAETSYAYTLEDFDGHPNTVSFGSNDTGRDVLWNFSVQGQADEVRAVMASVNRVDSAMGIGMFYWEGAWITVGDTSGLVGDEYAGQLDINRSLWETHGSGWASSYSAEYDADDAGKWFGGSAVDNQAFFDSSGRTLPSLRVFKNVLTGSINARILLGDVSGDGIVSVKDVTEIQKYLADITALSNEALIAADADQNGSLTISDASCIQRYLADYNLPYPINGYI